jgi:hypothetical protein
MMSALKADRFRTIGGLFSAWCLLDEQTEDGLLENYTPQIFDDFVGFQGLANAMILVGWLEESPQGLVAVNFTEHNGQTAKRRAQDSVRKMSAREADKTRTKPGQNPDQRREEKRIVEKSREEKEKRIEETEKESPSARCEKFARAEYSEQFQRFWDAYPTRRRLGKKQAYAAWQKAIRTADPKTIIGKASEYASSDRGRGEFSCMPTTWLNQGRWEDDPAAWQDDRTVATERKPSQPKTFAQIREENTKNVFRRFEESGQLKAIFDAVNGASAVPPSRSDGGDAAGLLCGPG